MKATEVMKNLYVGSKFDYEKDKKFLSTNCYVIHACKTYHKMKIGYSKSLDKSDSRYLKLLTRNEFYANLVDVPMMSFFNYDLMEEIVNFAVDAIQDDNPVYIHCDQGESRSPMIAMLVMKKLGYFGGKDFLTSFKIMHNIYPSLNPGQGIYDFCNKYWENF